MLPSGRRVDRATYERFTEPIEVTLVAGPRKTALVFILDQYGLPWTWEAPEGILEERLRQFDGNVYRQFLRDHGLKTYREVSKRTARGSPIPRTMTLDESPSGAWERALNAYRYDADLTRFSGADQHPGWFGLNIDPGDPLQTMGFETRFRGQARRHLEAWAEVVFWKLYTMPPARNGAAQQVFERKVRPAVLWGLCLDYVTNPNIESFRVFRNELFDTGVATAATFPAFICPERFPMVDTQTARWAIENGSQHGYSGVGGPDLECVPELGPGDTIQESDWRFVETWLAWCRFTAWRLSQRTQRWWRARDAEMAVFAAQKRQLTLPPLV